MSAGLTFADELRRANASEASGPNIVARRVATMNYITRPTASESRTEDEEERKTHSKSDGISEPHYAGKNSTYLPR